MKDFLRDAHLVKGDVETQMWGIAREELKKCPKPILLVSDLSYSNRNPCLSISKIDQIPRYGKDCDFLVSEFSFSNPKITQMSRFGKRPLVSQFSFSNSWLSISKVDQIPRYGKKCKFDILEEIYWTDICTSEQPLSQMVNELLAKHYHGNKIFITEIAHELCYEEDFS